MKTEDSSRTGKCLVPCFQGCASIVCFTGLYSLSSLTTSTLGVYISSQITTLEKQFGFNSSQSGFLLSCNDVGFLAFTLFISYRAATAHIPRALAVSTILFGLAGILCSCAFFLNPNYKLQLRKVTNDSSLKTENETEHLRFCNKIGNGAGGDICDDSERQDVVGTATSFTPVAMAIIAIGMILQGVGKAPRAPFSSYYIDENVDKRKTSLYLGVLMTIGIFGPALAFVLGAVFSNIYVTLEDVKMSTKDPRWIGAWWLGFLLFGITAILVALPIFCFPKRYRNDDSVAEQIPPETTFMGHITGFVKTCFRLFKNGCFTFCILGSCCQMFFVAGMVSFLPKFLETQFTIPTWHANLLMGGMNICSAALGTFVGGFVVYKCRMTPYQCIRLSLVLTTVTALVPIAGFFIGCDNPEIIGYNMESSTNVTSCMSDCNCDGSFFPVCGSDNRNYFSYCHAGCTGHDAEGYTDCACIGQRATAKPGLCKPECNMLYIYVAMMFVFALIQTVAIMPDYIFTMRCVDDKDKAMAIAFRSLLSTVLGWFPGPVIVGKVVDSCCVLWNSSCQGTGACALYDLEDFRYRRHGLDAGVKILSTIFYLMAFLFARRRLDLREHTIQNKELKIPEGEMLMEKPKITVTDEFMDDSLKGHQS